MQHLRVLVLDIRRTTAAQLHHRAQRADLVGRRRVVLGAVRLPGPPLGHEAPRHGRARTLDPDSATAHRWLRRYFALFFLFVVFLYICSFIPYLRIHMLSNRRSAFFIIYIIIQH